MNKFKEFFSRPYGVMGLVLLMYFVKVAVKLSLGHQAHSPVLTADGFHNASDIPEALFVILTVYLSTRPPNRRFPWGFVDAESLFGLFVGAGLCLMAAKIAIESLGVLGGMIAYQLKFTDASPDIPIKMGGNEGWLIVAVMCVSAGLSFLVSAYQIRVGRKTGHSAVEADGMETRSDGMIEVAACVGLSAEHLFQAAWIEYLLSLVIVGLMIRAGLEIIRKSLKILLRESIGLEHDNAIKKIVEGTVGVFAVRKFRSYMVGNRVVLDMKLESSADAEGQYILKHGIAPRITAYLKAQEFTEAEYAIRFDPVSSESRRIAIALRANHDRVADSLEDTTHLVIADDEQGVLHHPTSYDAPDSVDRVIELLKLKRVQTIYFFDPKLDAIAIQDAGIEVDTAISFVPSNLGL